MKEILNFINNNAIIASLIAIIITTIIQILFKKDDRKYNKKIENEKIKRKQYENKAELFITNNMEDDGSVPRIQLILSDFNVEIADDKSEVKFNYPNKILNKNKYKHMIFYLKNIGNADINQLDICVTSQKRTMICDVHDLKFLVKNKSVNYNYLFDKKILKRKAIMLDISFLEDSRINNVFSSELALLYKDSYGNIYEQPFFIQEKNLYEPIPISYKEYKSYINTETAIECFKKPWLW